MQQGQSQMPQSMIDALRGQQSQGQTETQAEQTTEVVTDATETVEVETPITEVVQPTVETETEVVATTEEATTETATETAAETTTTESDPLWFDKPTLKAGETAPTTTEVDYKAKYMEVEDILKRPEVAAIVEAIKNNVPIDEVLDKIKRVDYTKLDANGLIAQYGKLKGRTEEQIESDAEMFASLTVSAQDREMEFMQQKLDAAQNERLKGLSVVDPQVVAKQKAVESKLISDVQARTETVGKEILGLTISKQDVEEYQAWVFGGMIPTTEDGHYDESEMFKQWFGAKRLSKAVNNIAKSAKQEGINTGKKEILKKVHNPSDNGVAATRVPVAKPALSDAEQAAKGFANHFGIKRN
jgi:hypothetical protein